jgi:1,4-alpha-glucan branching enzyme
MNANNYGYIPAAGSLIGAVNSMIHTGSGKLSIAEDVYGSFGFDSAWDTTYPYVVTTVLANGTDANRDMNVIANAVLNNVRYGGTAGGGRVTFLETHDVVGDLNSGIRLVTAIDPTTPNSYRARKLSTLGAAVTVTAPGVPMIFQGQEMLENQAFSSSRMVDWSKTNTFRGIVEFYRDLIGARRDLKGYTPGLKGQQCSILQLDNTRKLIAFRRWNAAGQDAVVVANFSGTAITGLNVNFPSTGTWYVHLNSDSSSYSADYQNIGSSSVLATGSPAKGLVTVAPYSALILSQTPDTSPQLNIHQSNGTVTIEWPSSYSEWVLMRRTAAIGDAGWLQIPTGQYQTNGSTNYFTVNPGSGNSWYRLQKP